MSKIPYFILTAIIVVTAIFFVVRKQPETPTLSLPTTVPTPTQEPSSITATFEIYTLGTKRIFSDSKYHNKSDEIYITSKSPNIIYSKKTNATWADFFATLPMKLTNECLTTGTGQVFCDGQNGNLVFEINGVVTKDALAKVIKNGDSLKVVFK